MQRTRFGKLVVAIAALFLCLGQAAVAPGAEPERVRFITADYVEIQGLYYPSDLGIKAPTVILLHPLGGSIEMPGWTDLAKKLQEKRFAVLAFDFRGHGNSVNVTPQFWMAERTNQSLKGFKPAKPKGTISYNDFRTPANFVGMMNDIAGAKRLLDTKNDGSECNSAKTFVIGAGSGATLGAVWINSEWSRRALKSGFPIVNNNQAEGHDIAGAVWLSMAPSVGNGSARWTPRLESYVSAPAVRDNVPMLFLYGEQDPKSASLAKSLHSVMVKGIKDKKVKDLMRAVGLKDTKLSGAELLGKPSLRTEETILTYLTQVLEERAANPWVKKDIDKTAFGVFPINAYLR
jgi:alpha/beta hydrolase fold